MVTLAEGSIHLFAGALTDVGAVCAWKIKDQGDFYEVARASALVRGRWLGVPYDLVGRQVAYRPSVLRSLGVSEFPKTWPLYRDLGRAAKKAGRPFGQALSQNATKSNGWAYPFLWSWGAGEFERQGRRPGPDFKETAESVRFMKALWKEAFVESGFAWNNTNNDIEFYTGQLAATVDLPSIYLNPKAPEDVRKDTAFASLPEGPGGQFAQYSVTSHAILSTSKAPKVAADLIRWLHDSDRFAKVLASENGYRVGPNQSWGSPQRLKALPAQLQVFQTSAVQGRTFGYPGPPTGAALKIADQYTIVDMYVKGIMDTPAEEAVKWAQAQIARAYGEECQCQCKDGSCVTDCCPGR